MQVLAVRAGYGTGVGAEGLVGWTFGGGVQIRSFNIDYAFVPLESLGNMQRVSLNYAFGPERVQVVVSPSGIDREPILVFSDDDFVSAGLFGKEKLTPGAEARLYQALTQVSGIESAYIRINGNTSLMEQPYSEFNGPQLRAIGAERAGLVVEYLRLKMPRARVTSAVTSGAGKGIPASVFKVVLR